jgi:hypothetical protein
MGMLSFAADEPAVARSYGQNVLPFNTARHRSRVRLSHAGERRVPEGVVIRLPKAPRADLALDKRRAEPADSGEMRFTVLDFVATALLILSVFSGPALLWSLVRAASFG